MASPITWKNVDAPNTAGALDGLRIAGSSLDRAFQSASQGVTAFDTARRTDAENQVLNAAQGYQDPVALRAAIAGGQVFGGVDRNLVGKDALTALNGQAGTLLNQAVVQQTYNQNDKMNPLLLDMQQANITGKTQDNVFQARTADDRAAQIHLIPQQTAASIASTQAGTAGQLLSNTLQRETMPAQIAVANQKPELGQIQIDSGRQQLNQNGVVYARGNKEYDEQQAGQAAAAEILRLTPPGNVELAQKNLDDEIASGRLSPRAQVIAQQYLDDRRKGGFSGFSGDADPGANLAGGGVQPGGPGTAVAALRGAVGTGRQAGFQPVTTTPARVMPPGSDFRSAIVLPETAKYVDSIGTKLTNDGVDLSGKSSAEAAAILAPYVQGRESGGSSVGPDGKIITSSAGARGTMQIMPGTAQELEKKLGMAPGLTSELTPEGIAANRRAGQYYLQQMYERYGGDVQKTLAAYNAGPGRVDEWSGKQAQVAAAYKATGQEASRMIASASARSNETANVGITGSWAETQRSTPLPSDGKEKPPALQDINDVSARLRAPGQSFEKVGPEQLNATLRKIMAMSPNKINAAAAGELMTRYYGPDIKNGFTSFLGFTNKANEGDEAGLKAEVARINNGDIDDDAKIDTMSKNTTAMIRDALANREATLKTLNDVQDYAQRVPASAKNIPGAMAAFNKANAYLNQALASGRNPNNPSEIADHLMTRADKAKRDAKLKKAAEDAADSARPIVAPAAIADAAQPLDPTRSMGVTLSQPGMIPGDPRTLDPSGSFGIRMLDPSMPRRMGW